MTTRYVPGRGDLVWIDFDPQAGREQSGRRPAVVLSPESYMRIPPLELEAGEKLLAEVFANLFRGWEGVGGRLTVTDRRLWFDSHRWNHQVGSTEIPLGKVVDLQLCRTLGLIPNGLRVETRDGATYRFVVWQPRKLVSLIRSELPGHRELA